MNKGDKMANKKQQTNVTQEFKEVKIRRERSVYLFGEIDYKNAKEAIDKLLELNDDSQNYIFLYITSPGGCVQSGLAICDIIKGLESQVIAVCSGGVSSMATVIAASCDKVYATEHTRFMIHPLSYGEYGTIDKMRVTMEGSEILSRYGFSILANKMGCSEDYIKSKCSLDWYMSAKEAKEHKLVDDLLENCYLPSIDVKIPVTKEVKEDK